MMAPMQLAALAQWLEGRLVGEDLAVTGVSTDTRSCGAGDLFIALVGERFDAHQFVDQAIERGVAALLVERELAVDVPQIVVADSHAALGQVAAYNRRDYQGTLFAITGSSGKTSVKEMLFQMLSVGGSCMATKGNLNNDIGVPLTLLRLEQQQRFAVIEMGASGAGEIAYSMSLGKPQISLITNAMGAHLEGFGSLQGVVEAKGEIYRELDQAGTAIVNRDDPHADQWLAMAAPRRTLTFSCEGREADGQARNIRLQENGCYAFELHFQGQQCQVELQVLGRHNVANALAAGTALLAAGLPIEWVSQGASAFRAVPGRMRSVAGINGSRLIDDSYNANPGSVRAAINALAELAGKRVLVLGDMGELGDDSLALHRELGQYAFEQGIDELLGCGPQSAQAAQLFYQLQGREQPAVLDKPSAIAQLRKWANSQLTVLVKGSRSAAMEQVIADLSDEDQV